jgi:hypothetical protein
MSMKINYWLNQNRLLSPLRFTTALLLACVAAVFISATIPAVAGEMVPFNGTVSGYGSFLTLPHVVNFGHANQLGAFTGSAEFYPSSPDPTTGCIAYTGTFDWFAANGDRLQGTFEGQACPSDTPGVYDNHETADVNGDISTGRFAGATGHFELGGLIDFTMVPDFSFVLPWHGTISTVGSTRRH